MNTLNINGVNLAIETRGAGAVLIFVHGAVGDFRTWETQIEESSRHHRVITFSRRWHYPNRVAMKGVPYTPGVHVADLLSLMASQGPAHLVGHSYGAAVCAAAALQRPDLVNSLVLAEPSLFSLLMASPSGSRALAQATMATEQVVPLLHQGQNDRALREFLNIILGPAGVERLPARARAVMSDNLHTLGPMLSGMNAGAPFTAEHAAQITAPTLLVDGAESPAPFRLTLDALLRSMPNAQKITLPSVSHGLHLENPEAFSRVVLEFLAETGRAALLH